MTLGGSDGRAFGFLAEIEADFRSRIESEFVEAANLLAALAKVGSEPMRIAISSSPCLSFSPTAITRLASDPSPRVRAALASNVVVAFREDLAERLSGDVPEVRDALEANAYVKATRNLATERERAARPLC